MENVMHILVWRKNIFFLFYELLKKECPGSGNRYTIFCMEVCLVRRYKNCIFLIFLYWAVALGNYILHIVIQKGNYLIWRCPGDCFIINIEMITPSLSRMDTKIVCPKLTSIKGISRGPFRQRKILLKIEC